MLFLQLPHEIPAYLTKLRVQALREMTEFRLGLPTFVCALFVVAGATLYFLALIGLIMSEGEPWIWDCQGKLVVMLYLGSFLGVFGALFLPIIYRRRGKPVGLKYL